MRGRLREGDGQITVFLSLILLCMGCLMLGLVESARTAGARWYLQMAADSAMDSLMSQYHRGLWEEYRLFGLEYLDDEDLGRRALPYLEAYGQADHWYPIQIDRSEVIRTERLTDAQGGWLEREILDYMKYGIWSMDFSPDSLEGLPDLLNEASSVEEVSDSYSAHTRSAFRLEEALEAIEACQQRQKEHYEAAIRRLERYDGPGFREEAKRYRDEASSIEGLVRDYQEKADRLGEELRQTQDEHMAKRADMGQALSQAIEEEMGYYRSYTDADGQRRMEVEGLAGLAVQNIGRAEEAVRMAEEVEEILEEWDDEEDDPDEEALWHPVLRQFSGCQTRSLGVACGVEDKERQGWLEALKSMADTAILSAVLPEGTAVSNGRIPVGDLPSYTAAPGSPRPGAGPSLLDRMMVNEYCTRFFTDFRSDGPKEVRYEMEYLIAGKGCDKENLTAAVMEVIAMREGLNLVYLLSDGQKRSEAYHLAQSIVGFTGIGPLVLITAFFVMVVWALGEAIADVRLLLRGGKVPLWKTDGSWSLSLDRLLEFGRTGRMEGEDGGGSGLDYQGYLRLLLFLEDAGTQYYRMMDVIQMNLSRPQPGFKLERCAYRVDIRATGCGKHVFFSIGLVDYILGQGGYAYPVQVTSQKAY